jgi:hypothetical protein
MRRVVVGGVLAAQLVCGVAAGLWPAGAGAEPGTGPRETVDQGFTTKRPHSPTGITYAGAYHAAGDPGGNPPFLERMVFYPPPGMRYDTSVPDRCSAPDAVLQVMGPDACPAGSRLGGGTIEGLIFAPFTHAFVMDHFEHPLEILNNAGEQVVLVHSEGYSVVRGRFLPDGSLEFAGTGCFPKPPAGECPDDYVMQLRSSTSLPPYTRMRDGHLRGYATTPLKCPDSGYWRTTMRLWWADGSTDSVVSRQPCRGPGKRRGVKRQ